MINKATLVGRVGKVDTKPLKNGSNMTSVSLATSRKYSDAAGQKQEITTWHNVNFFSKMADVAAKYVHVGDLILVEGEISHKKIEQGEKAGQWSYSLTASDVKFITGSNKGAVTVTVGSGAAGGHQKHVQAHHPASYDEPMSMDEGVPF